MIAADAYGNFLPGPHGFPQLVTDIGLVEGDPAAPQPVDGNGHIGLRINSAFLNDIARAAVPTRGPDGTLVPDADSVAGLQLDATDPPGSYDDELLGDHFIAGDGRGQREHRPHRDPQRLRARAQPPRRCRGDADSARAAVDPSTHPPRFDHGPDSTSTGHGGKATEESR